MNNELLHEVVHSNGLGNPYVNTDKVKHFNGYGVILPIRLREKMK